MWFLSRTSEARMTREVTDGVREEGEGGSQRPISVVWRRHTKRHFCAPIRDEIFDRSD